MVWARLRALASEPKIRGLIHCRKTTPLDILLSPAQIEKRIGMNVGRAPTSTTQIGLSQVAVLQPSESDISVVAPSDLVAPATTTVWGTSFAKLTMRQTLDLAK